MNPWLGFSNKHKKHGHRPQEAAAGGLRQRRAAWRRTGYGLAGASIMGLSVLIQSIGPFMQHQSYELSPNALSLVGEVRDDAVEYLKLNDQQTAYEFAVPEQPASETSKHTGRVADAYSASFSTDPKQGISVTDKNTQVAVRLVPKFPVKEGRRAAGNQIVYPFGRSQLVYSLKYNGLKEDIIIPDFIADKLDYTFELVLPAGTEARLENGGIGIYTSDSSLFGNMSFGSDDDRARVEKARQNGVKNNLIMTIPAPIIKDAAGREYSDRSEFRLGERIERRAQADNNKDIPEEVRQRAEAMSTYNVYDLTIASRSLKDLPYPISIDPTFQVTSAADFSNVNLEPGVEIDYSGNLIRRGAVTGGTLKSWTSTMNLPDQRITHAAAVYNGYIYLVAGYSTDGGWINSVHYASINTDGTLGSWSATSSLIGSGRRQHSVAVYGGYIYVAGGAYQGTNYLSDVQYAKINADGTLGDWTATASLLTMRREMDMTAYNGYLYIAGGLTSGSALNRFEYARLNADGSIASDSGCGASWCSGNNLPGNRMNASVLAYNGWIYVIGGRGGAGTSSNAVYYARVNSDGSVGSWSSASSMNTARHYPHATIWNGYLYVVGGCTNYSSGCSSFLSSTEYAPIYADGSLGDWRTTSSINTAAHSSAVVTWNGNMYMLGGCISGDCNMTSRIEHTTINAAGSLHDGSWSSATNLPTVRRMHQSIAYNGYLYVVGGNNGSILNSVAYAPINTSGTLGSWTTSANVMNNARQDFDVVIYNGYMYVSGGQDSGGELDGVEYAAVNSDGSIGSWTPTTSLPGVRRAHALQAFNDYLYVIGGVPTTPSMVTYRASINSDGTLGSWISTGTLPTHRSNLRGASHVYNGRIYLVGGCFNGCPGVGSGNYSLYQTTVQYADINSDGTLGSWNNTTSFTGGRTNATSLLYNGYIYVLGGTDTAGSTPLSDVQFAPINNNGTLGSWEYTTNLNVERYENSAAVFNGMLYVIGGRSGVSPNTNQVQFQAVNNAGQGGPGSWSTSSTLSTARKNHASIVVNGYIYAMGGCTNGACSSVASDILYASLDAKGSIGSWSTASSAYTTARHSHYAFYRYGYIFIAGGIDASGTVLTDIQRISPQSNGDLTGGWTIDDTALPTTGANPGIITEVDAGNKVYVIGGASAETDVSFASINTSTGDIGGWTSTTSLPEGRHSMFSTIYKGYIYVMGGNSAAGRLRTVLFAPLNISSDGSVGTWNTTTQLNDAVSSFSTSAAFALNGYIYAVGGENSSGFYNQVQYAAILSGGRLGVWQGAGSYSGSSTHGNLAVAVWGGVVYMTGGQSGGGPTILSSTRYATLQSIPRAGGFSKVYDFEVGVRPNKLITRGTRQTFTSMPFSSEYSVACNDTPYITGQTVNDLHVGAENMIDITTGSATLARCLRVRYFFNDERSSVFPDRSIAQTQITDFDLYYTSNPGSRLRGGRTFTGGVDRGLDAAPQ